MRAYLDIVNKVLNEGHEKFPVRRDGHGNFVPVEGGIKTLACANVLFSHDMENGFPLLTTKKMAVKSMAVELEGFINGITDKKWYQERGCKIWNEWANPDPINLAIKEKVIFEHERKEVQKKSTDLGPIYGYQWRHFNEHYCTSPGDEYDTYKEDPNGVLKGSDQLKTIVDTLRRNPMDRRMVCSAWNPNQIHMMALPPCHYAWNVTVIGGKLNLFWAQRSCDLMLGVPFNIASYALLLKLLAYDAGLAAGNLSGMLVDCHIYENQIDAAREQVKRKPHSLPQIWFRNNSGKLKKRFSIFDWTHKDFELTNYTHHEKIDFGAVAV